LLLADPRLLLDRIRISCCWSSCS